MPYKDNEHIYFSHMTILNNLIREIKIRGLKLGKSKFIENIFIDIK